MQPRFSQGLYNQPGSVLNLYLERVWGRDRSCVSGVKCQNLFLARITLSSNAPCRGPIHVSRIERDIILSPPTVPFEETFTIISSNQAEVRAAFSVSSAEIVSHLCSTILGRNWDSQLWDLRWKGDDRRGLSTQLLECGWFSRLEATIMLRMMLGNGRLVARWAVSMMRVVCNSNEVKPQTWDSLLTKTPTVKSISSPCPFPLQALYFKKYLLYFFKFILFFFSEKTNGKIWDWTQWAKDL